MSDVIENTLEELKAFCAQRSSDYEEAAQTFKAIADAYDEDFTYGEIKEWAKQSQAQIEDLDGYSFLADVFDDYLASVDATGSWADLSADLCDRFDQVSESLDETGDGWVNARSLVPDLDDYSPNRLVYWIGTFADIFGPSDEQKIMDICEPLTGKI